MKVLYLLNSTKMGGANISFINLVKELSDKGVKSYIIYPDEKIDKVFKRKISPYWEKMYSVPMKSHYHDSQQNKIKKYIKGTRIYENLRFYPENKEVEKIVKLVNPDIIHTNVGVIQAGYKVSKKLNIPHIWHLREYQTKDFGWEIEPSKKAFIKRLNTCYTIAITEGIQQYFQLNNSPKSKVIYNGCFSEKDTNFSFPKEKYFLCCSRVSPEKGHEEVIKAFAEFHKTHLDYKLLIAGFGTNEYLKKLKKIAKTKNCADSIKFLGFRNDVRSLMDHAMALIVASKFEGFGRMTAEAAFRGCMVIGHNTGGTKEILSKIGGYSYDNGIADLIDKMNKVAELDESKYVCQAKMAQEKAVNIFSNEQSAKKIFEFYKQIMIKNKK